MTKIIPIRFGESFAGGSKIFDTIYKHPLLLIGHSYSILKEDVQTWLNENCTAPYSFNKGSLGRHIGTEELDEMTEEEMKMFGYELCFESDHDASLFALRWL